MKLNKIKLNKIKNQKGSLLTELMIGFLISSLTVLVVTTIYAQFEKQKRTTVQVGQAISNINVSMYPIQHNAKMAGYGIAHKDLLGCSVMAYNKNSSPSDFNFKLSPVVITSGASISTLAASALISDKIEFTYGSAVLNMLPVKLVANSNGNNANIKVEDKSGFKPGDLVILYEPGKNCNLAQVSGVSGSSDVVIRNTGKYTDPITGEKMDIIYNKAGGLTGGEDYTSNAVTLNIGATPQVIEYSIDNNQLIEKNSINATEKVVSDNVVLLKARYGLDLNDDKIVETWTDNIGADTNYKFLKAIKVAMIVRAPLKELQKNGVCNATSNPIFNWDGETIDITNIGGDADWGCYRYRFAQSVIPLRNMIWSLGN